MRHLGIGPREILMIRVKQAGRSATAAMIVIFGLLITTATAQNDDKAVPAQNKAEAKEEAQSQKESQKSDKAARREEASSYSAA